MPIAITLHLLAAVIWIGGMFFAHMVLRPSALQLLEPPLRLSLWNSCFKRFFLWVWLSVILLPVTGYWMVFEIYGGFDQSGWPTRIMHISGLIMIVLFLYLFSSPYRNFKRYIAEQNYPAAGDPLARIRTIVGTNLVIGLFTITIAAAGKHL